MLEAALIVCVAVGTLYAGTSYYRRRRERKAPPRPKPAIIAVERNGVVAAYRREDLPETKTGMLPPSQGIMVFSDAAIRAPTTGTMSDLQRLAETSKRPLVWESPYALYVPYTGGFASDIDDDAAHYGRLIVPPEQALPFLTR